MNFEEWTIEQLGDKLFDTREILRDLDAQKSAAQKEYDEVEYHMIQKMQDAGLSAAGISRCTFSLKAEMYPQVKDLDQFVRWAADNNKTEMLQRRVSAAVFREHFEETHEMPDGLDTYEKVTLGMRKR